MPCDARSARILLVVCVARRLFRARVLAWAIAVLVACAACRREETRPVSLTPETAAPSAAAVSKEPPAEKLETAVLAGGCFWGMEEILRSVPGVVETKVGYAGGDADGVTYRQVSTGETGHAESVRVVFDPAKLSFEDLLAKWFFRMHDPTSLNRQGNDVGTQYRSAIFYTTEAQKRAAERVKTRLGESGKFEEGIVTEIVPLKVFVQAEEYHQDYLQKNPGGYTCHYLRDW